MGRIPKNEKIKSIQQETQDAISSALLNKEINALVIFIFYNSNPIYKYTNNSNIYYPKEFKCWLNSQLDFSIKKKLLIIN